jgi:hypothetical protein
MKDPKFSKDKIAWEAPPTEQVARAAAHVRKEAPSTAGPEASRTGGEGATGRVVRDERGNAVWDWLSQTSRICLDATSRLLRKLEAPELKMEEKQDEELRLAPEPHTGGGYDPYAQTSKPPPLKKRK